MKFHKGSRRTYFSAFGITCSLLGVMFYLFVVPSSQSSYAGTINRNEQSEGQANLLLKQRLLEKSVEEFLNQSANARLRGLIEDLGKAAQQPTSPLVEISEPEVAEALKEHVATMTIEDQKLLSSFADHFGFSSLQFICHEFDGSSKGMKDYQGDRFLDKPQPMLAAAAVVEAIGVALLRGDPFSCPQKEVGELLFIKHAALRGDPFSCPQKQGDNNNALVWVVKGCGFFQDEKGSPLKDLDSYRLGIELD